MEMEVSGGGSVLLDKVRPGSLESIANLEATSRLSDTEGGL